MADIKAEAMAEKPRAINEKPMAGNEFIIDKLNHAAESEKIKNLDRARKQAINEIIQTEKLPPMAGVQPSGIIAPQTQRQKQIEAVLSGGLKEIYQNLAPAKQQEFKMIGEQTAGKINRLLSRAKVNIGDIIKLIKKWLSLIPGVNKYFLEQEAKIKADEIIKIKNENIKM